QTTRSALPGQRNGRRLAAAARPSRTRQRPLPLRASAVRAATGGRRTTRRRGGATTATTSGRRSGASAMPCRPSCSSRSRAPAGKRFRKRKPNRKQL
ncbi:MAG: hypothetical protein AVDCRST_MAG04-3027, partial [uncultured Acetobacteraceae bacterium]